MRSFLILMVTLVFSVSFTVSPKILSPLTMSIKVFPTSKQIVVCPLTIASRIPEQKGMKLPPLIFAQSGAIYFEK